MTPLQLAWRTTKRYRARTLLAITGVTVIGALLFDMLLLSDGLLASFADLLNSEGFEIRVVAHEGFARGPDPPQRPPARIDLLDARCRTMALAEPSDGEAAQFVPR